MTESIDDEQDEVLVEKAIIESFGDSIIEFQTALFHKYLISSGSNSLMTPSQFRKHLMRMYAKGYLVPLNFQRRRAWKRLIMANFVEQDVILTETSKPIETEPLDILSPEESSKEVKEHLVSDCQDIADEIISNLRLVRTLENCTDWRAKVILREHIRNMHHALTESRGQLFSYLETNLPDLRDPLEQLLNSHGDNKVLLSLRVIRGVP